jgi:hypothetical protein
MEDHGGTISAGETPDLSTRALCQYYQRNNLVAKQEELGEGNYEFGLAKCLCLYFGVMFYMPQNLTAWGWRLFFPSEGWRAADSYRC